MVTVHVWFCIHCNMWKAPKVCKCFWVFVTGFFLFQTLLLTGEKAFEICWIRFFFFFHLNWFSYLCTGPVASEPYLKFWDVFYPFPIPCQSQTPCFDSFVSSGSCLHVCHGRIQSCLNPVKCPDLAGGFDFCWSTWKVKMSHWSLKNSKQVVKIKMMRRRKGELGQIVAAGSGRAIGSFGWLWVKQTLPCLHVLMGQGPKPLFSLRFLGSVAWFGCRILFLWGRDTTVQQLCVSTVLCSTYCRTFSLINGFQAG